MKGVWLQLMLLFLNQMLVQGQEDPALRIEEPSARETAAEDSMVAALKKQFDSSDSATRVAIVRRLAGVADERAISILISALDDRSERVRWTAAEVLEVLSDLRRDEVIPAFIRALTHSDVGVRARAASVLGKTGATSAIQPLVRALDDPSELVRRRAADALDALGWTAQTEEERIAYRIARENWKQVVEVGDAAVGRLVRVLTGREFEQAGFAARALLSLGWKTQNTTERVAYLLTVEDHAAILKMGADGIIPLRQLLVKQDYWGRVMVADVLGDTGDPSVTPALVQALNDDFFVRRAAAQDLEKLGWQPQNDAEKVTFLIAKCDWQRLAMIGPPAVPALIKLMMMDEDGYDETEARAATLALGRTHARSATGPLIQALENKSGSCRSEAAMALGELRSEEAIRPLSEAIYEDDDSLREAAATALERIGLPAVKPLMEALDCGNPLVRAAAAKALASVHDDAVLSRLVRVLREDWDANVRRMAASALGSMRDDRAVQPLQESLHDRDEQVRQAANLALRRIDPTLLAKWRLGRVFHTYAAVVICVATGIVVVSGLVVHVRRKRI